MPAGTAALTVVNVGYRSTNFWVVSAGTSRLLVDLGWPGMADALFANIERMGIPFQEITHGLATHYHIDHGGAAQDLKNRGLRLIVLEEQESAIPRMKQRRVEDPRRAREALLRPAGARRAGSRGPVTARATGEAHGASGRRLTRVRP